MGHHNPTNVRAKADYEESAAVIHARYVAQDDAFHRAMHRAPECRPDGVSKRPGTEHAGRVRPPVTSIIRSSSGW
jgi:hypothetical protein